jgi:hypothetical protein
MMEALAVDHLVQARHQQLSARPDDRQGKNTRYAIKEAALGAFAVFFPQSPALLAYQRTMPPATGRSNAESRLRRGAMPGDHPIRPWLAPVAPAPLFPGCAEVDAALEGAGPRWSWRVFADQLLSALDGTAYVASQESHGARGAQRPPPKGKVTSVPQALTPVLVAPGTHEVITLEPAFITPQDGQATPDCEPVAAKRWMARQAGRYRRVSIFGDDLYGQPPLGELWLHHGFNCILVCKPASHTTLYAWIAASEAAGDLQHWTIRRGNGRVHEVHTYRYAHDVPWREGEDALWVQWCELSITTEADGTMVSPHACATPPPLDRTNVEAVVQAGRARWNIEHETNHVRKTQGDHLEQHYGHGQPHLAAV